MIVLLDSPFRKQEDQEGSEDEKTLLEKIAEGEPKDHAQNEQ
jgi:hypothetical protein